MRCRSDLCGVAVGGPMQGDLLMSFGQPHVHLMLFLQGGMAMRATIYVSDLGGNGRHDYR